MSEVGVLRGPFLTAQELARYVHLDDEAVRLLEPGLSPPAFLERLLGRRLFLDAVRFLPHVLPKRSAVWWGCLCAWQMSRPALSPADKARLTAALAWVLQPNEANRRAAGESATELESPAACLAQAAFWSTGSIVGVELPVVVPPYHVTPRLVGGAVLLAAVQSEPFECVRHYAQFLALGLEVARGRLLWTADEVEGAVAGAAGDRETQAAALSGPGGAR